MDMVTVRKLKKYYGSGDNQVRALDEVDLSVARGEFVAIVGASGSGKTTLLNMIGGLDVPTEGEVIVDGVSLAGLREEQLAVFRRKKVGFIFQNYNLIPTLTVKENILFPLELDGSAPNEDYLKEIVGLLGLGERMHAYPAALSGGQQQRVAIARALVSGPSVILADEPTGNLDSRNGQNVAGLLKMTAELYHRTLVMITHNQELAQLADRVLYMEDGKLREQRISL
ncbi:MAG: ABC transporter ATP-binding protein [Lachnospiraceae bacterium]|nr:ABC transporter ATP-binding protein [Lachnospiraceae bacterium]